MKRVLIISHAMEIGGAEKALLGLLNSFDYANYEVDLFLGRHEGELLRFLPRKVNLLPMNQARYLAVPIKLLIKKGQWKMLYGRLKAKLISKRVIKKKNFSSDNQVELLYSHKFTYSFIDFINPDIYYDLAISFLTPHYICLYKCYSKLKIAWIHTDYSTVSIDVKEELNMWKYYDCIVSISDKCTESFLKKMPELKNKIIRIDNIITKEMIINQSNAFFPSEMRKNSNELIFCSVGRFSYAKNFDNIPAICKKILEKGIKIKWYIIGYGSEENTIKEQILANKMENNVIILGKKINPYPYIKNCDYYIQPSRYEGKAVAVREAQMLGKVVIITDFPTAKSQLSDGYDGVIVPVENEKCATSIVDVIRNKELQNYIISNLEKENYSNGNEINKIYELMEVNK